MNGRVAKTLRRMIYKDDSIKNTKYTTITSGKKKINPFVFKVVEEKDKDGIIKRIKKYLFDYNRTVKCMGKRQYYKNIKKAYYQGLLDRE